MRRIDWNSITITDNYMFSTVFRDADLCRELLELILDVPIDHVEYINREQYLQPDPTARGIRMDVFLRDEAGTVFDLEMQNFNEGNLLKRSRYYLSANDSDCIAPGVSFEHMVDSYVVFVCSFDPFGRGLPLYTVLPHCREDGVEMPDGATRVFVNATAADKCENPRLGAFLSYLSGDTMTGDEFTRRVDDAVHKVRLVPEWRSSRMRLDMYLAEEKARGREEGRAEGLAEGLAEGIESGKAEQLDKIAQLSAAMRAVGRSEELLESFADPAKFEALLAEFGI